jgi:hypothetical protein
MAERPLDFLTQYVLDVLAQLDLGDMTEQERQKYVPQLVAQVEYRLGVRFMEQIPEDKVEDFGQMLDGDKGAQEWAAFWKSIIPEFDVQVKEVLDSFLEECKTIFAKTTA